MPIYEYACAACGHRFEALVPAGAAAAGCPECGGSDARRLLSLFAAPKGGDGAATPSGGCCGGACGHC